MPHGGKRNGAGRKGKADEIELIERLSPLDELAFKALERGLGNDDQASLKLFFNYRFGIPKQTIDLQGKMEVRSIKIVDVDGSEI